MKTENNVWLEVGGRSSSQDEELAAADATKAFYNSTLSKQMDPMRISSILLSPSVTTENPYQMALGRNPAVHPNIFQNLLNNRNKEKSLIRDKGSNANHQRFRLLSLNDQLKEFLFSQLLTSIQSRRRWQLATDLFLILRQHYPSCQIHIFGSLLSGLGDSFSDIDVYVDINGDDGKSLGERPSAKSLIIYSLQEAVADILKEAHCRHCPGDNMVTQVELIGTRIPIVRFKHVQSGVFCDLSFGSRISVQNTKLIMFYMDSDPRVRPLIVFLRYWGSFHGICGSQRIKKYALLLIAIVFLTKKNIIPSIALLQKLAGTERLKNCEKVNPDEIDGWDASFCTDRKVIAGHFQPNPVPPDYHQNAGSVLLAMAKEFFEMILNTDLASKVICPLAGRILSREALIDLDLADEVEEPIPAVLRKWRLSYDSQRDFCKDTRIFKPLVIQDPFVLEFNVAGLVDQEILDKFCDACLFSVKILRNEQVSILDLFQ